MLSTKRGINKFLRKLHIYGGLFLTFYLIVLGVSSLQFQHRFIDFQPGKNNISWDRQFQIPEIEDRHQLKSAIRDSLDLNGYLPWWEEFTDSLGIYHFMISRPGKQYWITVSGMGDHVLVDERRTAFMSVVFALHQLTAGFEGPGFAKAWRIISELMSVLLLVTIVLAVRLWYTKSFSKKGGWIFAGAIASFSILLIALVWLIG